MQEVRVSQIDLNCDAGESYGNWKMGDDEAMYKLVSSVNIACGGHAGDSRTMADSIAMAVENKLGIGAHPSFEDKINFGRRRVLMSAQEIERMVAYQVGGLAAVAALQGIKLDHVKAHGALSNLAAVDKDVADAIARATRAISPELILLAIAGTQLQSAGERANLLTISEGFADRSYDEFGQLTPRSQQGAVIHDPGLAAQRCLDMALGKGLPRIDGGYVSCEVQSICVHGDTPGAVSIAAACRQSLESAGFEISSFSKKSK
jgi:UPF0271 protein